MKPLPEGCRLTVSEKRRDSSYLITGTILQALVDVSYFSVPHEINLSLWAEVMSLGNNFRSVFFHS